MKVIGNHHWRLAAAVACVCALTVGCSRPAELGPVADAASVDKIREALGGSGEQGEEAAAATGTGWATIKGRFTYGGDKPVMPPYAVNKDTEVCATGGKTPAQEYLLVDEATKGIANVVIYPRTVSRVHDSAKVGEQTAMFDQK